MGTPLADRIREKAQQAANKPMTPTGASSAMAKQAAVSSTGKAAAPGVGLAQSSVQESAVAAQAEQQQASVAEDVQAAGEQMAVTEQAADVKQEGVESSLTTRELQADNDFNNKLSEMSSRIKMADTKEEQDRITLEMKGSLMTRRLEDKKWVQALTKINKRANLQSKEEFAIAMSQLGLSRDRELGDKKRERTEMVANRARESGAKLGMAELMAALGKSKADAEQGAKDAKTGLAVGVAAAGAKAGVTAAVDHDWGDAVGEDNHEAYIQSGDKPAGGSF